jgi:hypothetical protein
LLHRERERLGGRRFFIGRAAHDRCAEPAHGLALRIERHLDKSNEIVAIPALLDMMAIEGAIMTIDAMGCQRGIAEKIGDKKADYMLALKGNQGSLREDVEIFAAEQKANGLRC